jgi:hypothetical protein
MNQKKNSTETNGHELYFEWYLQELESAGFITRYDREPETMLVIPPYIHSREKHFKAKQNEPEDFALIKALEYTYDYRIIWNAEKAIHIFTDVFDSDKPFRFGQPTFVSHWLEVDGFTELVSFVDVKPHFVAAQFSGAMSSFYTFPLIQKILMFTRSIYVNKAIPINSGKHGVNTCLFAKTFTPNRYLFTDKAAKKRTIKFRTVPLKSYVNRQENIIETYRDNEAKKGGAQQSLL